MATPPIIAGNWKMNLVLESSDKTYLRLEERRHIKSRARVIIIPPATLLSSIADQIKTTGIFLGAQNCHEELKGAFTGEVSAEMLASAGCNYVILSHSERRTLYGEKNALIKAKMSSAIKCGLTPIVCVGESLRQREAGGAMDTVGMQLEECLIDEVSKDNCIIAYEPIWAIGTGQTAEPDDIEEIHSHIRNTLKAKHYNSDGIPILYGGSVKPENVQKFWHCLMLGERLLVVQVSILKIFWLSSTKLQGNRSKRYNFSSNFLDRRLKHSHFWSIYPRKGPRLE